MMNHCAIQQKNAYGSCEDMARDYVVCPKPRRAGRFNSSVRPAATGWHMSRQADVIDAGSELLDIILSKGSDSEQTYTPLASSPPFFSGSPPVRVSNPLIHDARFVEVKQQASLTPSTYLQNPAHNLGKTSSSSSSLSSRNGGFARNNFGNDPAVRIEGFEALDRDRRNCSIPTIA